MSTDTDRDTEIGQADRDMAARQAREAVAFQQKMLEGLRLVDPAGLTPGQLIRWLDVAAKVERASRRQLAGATGGAAGKERDLLHRLLADPAAVELACQLADRVAELPP